MNPEKFELEDVYLALSRVQKSEDFKLLFRYIKILEKKVIELEFMLMGIK